MNRLLHSRNVAAGVVLACIFMLGCFTLVSALPALRGTAMAVCADDSMTAKQKIAALEATLNDHFFAQNVFIEGYALVQRTLGKETMKDFTIAKDTDGKLHYVYFQTQAQDVSAIGDRMARLAQVARENGAECLYMMTPSKIIEGQTTFSAGLPVPDENATVDAFLAYLAQNNLPSLDLRQAMQASGIPAQQQFFNTDHHWTPQSAFVGYTALVDYLQQEYQIPLDPDGFYTNLEHYNQVFYPQSYLGSAGRAVGVSYAGVDDFTLIYPKFSTSFSYKASNGEAILVDKQQDAFERSLLATSVLNQNASIMSLEGDKYFAYLSGNYGFAQITNYNNPDGARVLFIKDSLAVPVAAFLSSTCAQVDLIDPRWYEGSITQYLAEHEYDVVIVSFSPPNLTEAFFDF